MSGKCFSMRTLQLVSNLDERKVCFHGWLEIRLYGVECFSPFLQPRGWFKGADTTTIAKFLEHKMDQNGYHSGEISYAYPSGIR